MPFRTQIPAIKDARFIVTVSRLLRMRADKNKQKAEEAAKVSSGGEMALMALEAKSKSL